jgi:prostasin
MLINFYHYISRLQRNRIRVILGDYDQFITTETNAIMRAVTAVIRHQNFDQNTYNHDVALLRLRKPLVFGKTIAPICLPDDGLEPAGKIPFFLFGLEKIGGLFLFF